MIMYHDESTKHPTLREFLNYKTFTVCPQSTKVQILHQSNIVSPICATLAHCYPSTLYNPLKIENYCCRCWPLTMFSQQGTENPICPGLSPFYSEPIHPRWTMLVGNAQQKEKDASSSSCSMSISVLFGAINGICQSSLSLPRPGQFIAKCVLNISKQQQIEWIEKGISPSHAQAKAGQWPSSIFIPAQGLILTLIFHFFFFFGSKTGLDIGETARKARTTVA